MCIVYIKVLKFGGSSLDSAPRILNVASIIERSVHRYISTNKLVNFPNEDPTAVNVAAAEEGQKKRTNGALESCPNVVVLSAMGKTTALLIEASNKALREGLVDIQEIESLHYSVIKELGLMLNGQEEGGVVPILADSKAIMTLGTVVRTMFEELTLILKGVSILQELSPATLDLVMSFGERLSVRIVSGLLNKRGIAAKCYDAYDIGMRTKGSTAGCGSSEKVDVEVKEESYGDIYSNLAKEIASGIVVPVVTGFIAKNESNKICTLGRGGSDLTASIIGCALSTTPTITTFTTTKATTTTAVAGPIAASSSARYVCDEIQIWSDSDGVMTADPRIVKSPKCLEFLTFDEAGELAVFGAKILHPRSILPAMNKGIDVRVKNTYNPTHPGTIISSASKLIELADDSRPSKHLVNTRMSPGVVSSRDFSPTAASPSHPSIPKLASRNNNTLNINNSNVYSSSSSLSSLASNNSRNCLTAISLKSPVILVDIKSTMMLGQYGFLAKVFGVFNELKISIDVIATSEVSISLTLDKDTSVYKVEKMKRRLNNTASVEIQGERSILALICHKKNIYEIIRKACKVLQKCDIPLSMLSLGSSKINISLVVPSSESRRAVVELHDEFFGNGRGENEI